MQRCHWICFRRGEDEQAVSRLRGWIFWLIVFTVDLLSDRPAGLEAAEKPSDEHRFVSKFCTNCHSSENPEGEFRLDDLTDNFTLHGSRWAIVIDKVRRGKMPPRDAEVHPDRAERESFIEWATVQLGTHAQRRPNSGNLVPHGLLFGSGRSEADSSEADTGGRGAAARLWRLSPDGYLGWVTDVARRAPAEIVQPFSVSPERGIKDFAALARVDEPTTEILIRNARAIVQKQTACEIVDGRLKRKNDSVREFTALLDPSVEPTPALLSNAIQKQFRLAIARDPDAGEVERLLQLYSKCAEGGDRDGALKTMLTAVLLQADAVFRSEMGDASGMLTPYEAAGALSAALMYRRERGLFSAAEKGELSTREQLASHVRRILDDPKIRKPRVLGFFHEYFEYDKAPTVFKDEPDDLWHRPDQAVRDTDRLVLHLVEEDRDVFRELLTTPLAFANVKDGTDKKTRRKILERALVPNPHNQRGRAVPETLYGLEEWTAEQPFKQKTGTRLGILMQPSWLIAWSENFNNDIVRRGRFIRERLLGGTVPDLPIGVVAMISDERHRTLRDRVSSATRSQECWKCHRLMDDLGLPFEGFDHFGRQIAAELVLDVDATEKDVDRKGNPLGEVFRSVPLDTTGLIDGTGDPQLDGGVKDARELVKRLADSDRCRQVWIRHAFRYYLGRNETLADAETLQEADRVYLATNGSFKAMLVSLLTSDSFLFRKSLRKGDST